MAVEAVRTAPGQFILAAEDIHVGLEFICRGERYLVIGEPWFIAPGHAFARVSVLKGHNAGEQFTLELRAGQAQ
jgi:hypothetical protein